jgi:cbb3-type cytochrome oxidase subunit 1
MTTVISIFLVVHLLGFAALFGGLLCQVRQPQQRVNELMRDGAGTVVVAGLILFGLVSAHEHPGAEWHWKMAVKLVVGIVVLALVMMNLRKESISKGLYGSLLFLTVANVCVAAIWNAS